MSTKKPNIAARRARRPFFLCAASSTSCAAVVVSVSDIETLLVSAKGDGRGGCSLFAVQRNRSGPAGVDRYLEQVQALIGANDVVGLFQRDLLGEVDIRVENALVTDERAGDGLTARAHDQ